MMDLNLRYALVTTIAVLAVLATFGFIVCMN
ncbi:MAG: YnhF family membrane protein [Gilliamella sp.]|nr:MULTISPECIES: YnhF family membrane protein [Gilliamella]MCO6552458.1 YnhF family membrane protein [Gilliamella sp.]MCO6559758.1 YnhF family membrane protein [Gilliamella sp.]